MYKSQFQKLTLMTGFVVQGHICNHQQRNNRQTDSSEWVIYTQTAPIYSNSGLW